jgi:hypothetical protein
VQERDAMVGGTYFQSKQAASKGVVSAQAKVRFVRTDCVRLLFEGEMAVRVTDILTSSYQSVTLCSWVCQVVYHCMDNYRGFREHEEQSIEFGPDFGPALECVSISFSISFCRILINFPPIIITGTCWSAGRTMSRSTRCQSSSPKIQLS